MKGIHLERFYPHPVPLVWEAIATSRGLAAWLMPNTFEPRVGHRFQFRWKKVPGWRGIVDCEVLELVPERRLVFSWVGDENQRPTRVTFALEPQDGGTRLVLDHDGFAGFGGFVSKRMMSGGWKGKLLGRQLPQALDTLAARGADALKPSNPDPETLVKADYWNVTDEQVVEKTGKTLAEWGRILDRFGAAEKKSNDVVAYLQNEHDVPRYWARTLTTNYLKRRDA